MMSSRSCHNGTGRGLWLVALFAFSRAWRFISVSAWAYFAVAALRDWHRGGLDVEALLPVLSAYLGHLAPANTYWYYSDSRVIPMPAPFRRDEGPVTWGDVGW